VPDDAGPFAGLPEDVAVLLWEYRPGLASERYAGLIAAMAAAVGPVSKDDASGVLGALSGLVLWAQETGLDVEPEVLLARDVVDRYVAVGLREYADSTRRHVRRHLDRVAAAHGLTGPPRVRGSVTGDEPPEEPYTAMEVDALLSWADGQPSARRRRSLLALLALGLGCGLTNAGIRGVAGTDVAVEGDGTVLVRVGGDRPRDAVCARRFERLLASLAPDAGSRWLVDPLTVPRDVQAVVEIVHGARPGAGVPSLAPQRCRATWLLERMAAGVRVDVLAAAAGMADAQDLFARRAWQLDPEPEDRARAALRTARHPPGLLQPARNAVVRAAAPAPAVSPEAQQVLDRYRGRTADPRHAPVVRAIAAAAGPASAATAGFMATAAADLVAWADRHGHSTGLDGVLTREVVDAWAGAPDGAGRWTMRTRSDRVGWVEKAVAVLAPDQALPDRDARPGPYSRAEVDALTAWAGSQQDPAVRLPLTALLTTALGTGLRAEELKLARGIDVTRDDATGAVLVAARRAAGAPPHRVVPVLAEHEDGVVDAARRAGPGWLLDPHAAGTRLRAVEAVFRAAPRAAGVPVLTARRCRVTWLTAHLASGTRPDTLLRAAGLASTANLDVYAAMLQPMPPEQARRSLRGDPGDGALAPAGS